MKIHFITYANEVYKKASFRLCNEAKDTNWFDSITNYSPIDLDDNFKEKFKNLLNKRGAGYWIWKSYIIKKKLQEIDENDILIYMDAGCTINSNGEKRFYEYIDLLNNSNEGVLSFQLKNKHIEKIWTTKEIFEHFNINLDSTIANSPQILSTVRVMKKNENLTRLIDIEYNTYINNPLLVTDHYNKIQESYFIDNRHDQSIFSIIRKLSKEPILLSDETNPVRKNYPFWATRKRS